MKYSETDSDKFDHYLGGDMNSAEKLDFEERLSADPEFAAAFTLHKMLAAGIQEYGRSELKTYLKDNGTPTGTRGIFGPRNIRFALAASVLLIAGLFAVLHYYTAPEGKPTLAIENTENIPSGAGSDSLVLDNIRKEVPVPAPAGVDEETVSEPPPNIRELQAKDMAVLEPIQSETIDAPAPEAAGAAENDRPLDIVTEKRLKDTSLLPRVLYWAGTDPAENKIPQSLNRKKSLSETTTPPTAKQEETYNKTGAQPDSAVQKPKKKTAAPARLQVQYWSSPLHFTGYRLGPSELRLYGLKEQLVQIYLINQTYYLRYDGRVYRLDPCSNACLFKPESDPDLSNYILRQ